MSNHLNIWLVTIGEPLPLLGQSPRLYRCGILAGYLKRLGHKVTWWSSAFDHTFKNFVNDATTGSFVWDDIEIITLKGSGYGNNISLARLRDHWKLAEVFKQQAIKHPRPDVIVASYPAIELCAVCTWYGEKYHVPVLLDIRDLWPDIFAEVLPQWLQPLGSLGLLPYQRLAQKALRKATGLIGITPPFLEWGLAKTRRSKNKFDAVFAMGYKPRHWDANSVRDEMRSWWQHQGVDPELHKIIAFFGTFGRQFDLSTIIPVARSFAGTEYDHVRFVLCGTGDNWESFKNQACNCKQIVLPGWIDAPRIHYLMQVAHCGLAPYFPNYNFKGNVANKPIEYLSAGLPIMTCLEGLLSDMVHQHNLGYVYTVGTDESLRSVIIQSLQNPQEHAIKRNNCLKLFEEEYHADKVYSDYCRHIEMVAHSS